VEVVVLAADLVVTVSIVLLGEGVADFSGVVVLVKAMEGLTVVEVATEDSLVVVVCVRPLLVDLIVTLGLVTFTTLDVCFGDVLVIFGLGDCVD